MKDDPSLQTNDVLKNDNGYSIKQRKIRSSNRKSFQVLMVILIILIFVAGVLYFLARVTTRSSENLMEPRLIALEQKVSVIEKRLEELQGGPSTGGSEQSLLRRIEELSQKIEVLERQKRSIGEQKPPSPPKSKISAEKQYHIVQRGETLYGISKKYRISVEELMRINSLSPKQPLKTGQKILISQKSE